MHQSLHVIFRQVGYALAELEAPSVQAQLVELNALQIWPQGRETLMGLGHFRIVEFWSRQGACKQKHHKWTTRTLKKKNASFGCVADMCFFSFGACCTALRLCWPYLKLMLHSSSHAGLLLRIVTARLCVLPGEFNLAFKHYPSACSNTGAGPLS